LLNIISFRMLPGNIHLIVSHQNTIVEHTVGCASQLPTKTFSVGGARLAKRGGLAIVKHSPREQQHQRPWQSKRRVKMGKLHLRALRSTLSAAREVQNGCEIIQTKMLRRLSFCACVNLVLQHVKCTSNVCHEQRASPTFNTISVIKANSQFRYRHWLI